MPAPSALLQGSLALAVLLPATLRAQDDASFAPIRFGDPGELAYTAPYFPGATYDERIPTPDALLGQTHGSRLAHHAEVLAAFRAIDEASPRITLHSMGATHEGRALVYAVVTSEANHARIDAILGSIARLADPRGLSPEDATAIVDGTPAVAWMAYSIHGDELSGTDASVALLHHLAAGTDAEVLDLLEKLVIVIDPCQNPDGRERIIGMVEQSAGYTPNLDYASMHRGRWPHGRGNHYLFDMNRDWAAGTQPETRARWQAIRRFNPQLLVDAHEMGALDTFLFYPQAEPLNPELMARHLEWQGTFAAEAARAFDSYGWSYYTREWADGWAPFYTDAWGSLIGAIGILYEQAGIQGSAIRRASGEVLTYREAVHHQAIASLANLRTLAAQRAAILASYVENKRRNVAPETPGNDRMFVVRTELQPSRERAFLAALLGQGIEVHRTEAAVQAGAADSVSGARVDALELPAGSWIVLARQPQRQLVRALLDREQRMDKDALQREREELERKESSKIYDVTSWCLPLAMGVDGWWCAELDVQKVRIEAVPPPHSGILEASAGANAAPAAWIVDGRDDGAVAFAARALEHGVALNFADRAFTSGERRFARGSLVVRRAENPGDLAALSEKIRRAAEAAEVVAWATATGRSPDEGPDLGGQHFHLLARPRVAILANSPVRSDVYGHLWHHLDTRLGLPFTILDAQDLGSADLRRFNVLVLPPGGLRDVLEPMKEELERWVEAGGTLIACGSSAALLTKGRFGLSSAVLRRDALKELDEYALIASRQRAARAVEIDEALVWEGEPTPAEPPAEGEASGDENGEAKEKEEENGSVEELDDWRRRFAPFGATLAAEASSDSWITAGCDERIALDYSGSDVLLSKEFADVRFAPYASLRVSGLLWPEARERIADSVCVLVERKGAGSLVLFAANPCFRGTNRVSARLFSNALVYGPGLGASQPIAW